MECNKEEGLRAMGIAKRKLSESDYLGAKKFGVKAQNLYPDLDGLRQILLMIDVFVGSKESDLYGILGVEDPLADDETLKRQYKKLALLLHPDKNRTDGAEDAFKLVSEAWCLLSDKSKRLAYDQKRRSSKQVHQQKKKSDTSNSKKPMSSTSGFKSESAKESRKEFSEKPNASNFEKSQKARADFIAAALAKRRFEESRKKFSEEPNASNFAAFERIMRSGFEKSQKARADFIAAALARGNKEETERVFKKRKTTTRDDAYDANQAQEEIMG